MKVVTGNGEFDLGTTETTPTIGMTDFSRRVTDDFGVTTVVERGFSRRMSVKLGLPFDTVDAVQRRLSDLRAAPALWVADDRFVWLSLYGFYKDFDLDLASPPLSRCTLSIDGLAETGGVTDNGADPALGQASTLQLLQPVPVTDAMLAGSLVAENDAPAWAAGTGYAKGARVIRASTHRVYESLITGNTGKTPEAEPAWWLDLGPTNRWAMFDQALGTATTRNGGVEVTLNGGTANAVSLIDLVGDTVRVRANGYDQTQAVKPGALTFTGLPGAGQVIVTVSGAQAAVGTLLIGRMVGLGVTEAAPTAGITDFSRKETDDFGAVSVVERGYLKRMTARALIRTDAVDIVADRMASVRARPSLWIGQSGVDAITVYGFVKDFEIEVGTAVSKLSLTVEGLTKAAPIATTVAPLVPRGAYNAATIYADGALVEDQGVTWRYINATPTSGYAPPTLSTTSNAFWQVFASAGMTPEQQAEYDRLVAALAALTSDNIIAAGGEKNQIIQLYQQVSDLSGRAHTASGALVTVYGADPTYAERVARDDAMGALNSYLGNLGPPNWNDVAGDTPVDGPKLRQLFADAQATANALLLAVNAYVSSRTKGAIDRVAAIGSDSVLSAGSEKQTAVIEWNTLYQDLESLYGKYVALGSPADLQPALNAASSARTALGTYLGNLAPPWNQISTDTPIVSADWSSNWTTAYQRINDFRAQIAGRKGDKGDAGPNILLSATPQVIRFSADGVILSGPVTFRADLANLSGTVTWRSLVGHQLYDFGSNVTFDGNTMTISAARMRDVLNYNEANVGTASETIIAELGGLSQRVTVTKQVDGSRGTPGPGGFSHLAYANSPDGTVDFHTSNAAGRRYLGSYTDQVEADSEDPARYAWQLIQGAAGVSPIAVSLQPPSIVVQTLSNGTPYGGQFPFNIGVTAAQAGSSTPVTGISIVSADGMTLSLNPLRVTAVSKTDAYAVIDVSAAGQTQRVQISATINRDGADGGVSTRIAINTPQLTWTGYTQHGNSIGINASSTGKLSVNLTGLVTGDPAADYVMRFVSKLQYRAAGGTWTDVAGSEATSTEGGTSTIGDGGPTRVVRAAVNGTGPYTITGLAADAAYEVRAMTYRTSNAGSSAVGLSLYAERVQ